MIRVNANALTQEGWAGVLDQVGFSVKHIETGPMSLLTPAGLLRDEGMFGTLKIIGSVITKPRIRKRILAMRKFFADNQDKLAHITICAVKGSEAQRPTDAKNNLH